ncbi:hypothetical protein IP92_01476 [Pseudoduganella flava]|uniref:DUF4280 domain-containing protein n=1 Tax=Pseudoduganella flava TaxID=871742 RepID=A0A562Q0Q3_9BURK|nr:hypothetical protein [Pseudoduganella flava]QGZ38224.1 hypothetical protein GO485_03600 [Pseudoduganella flava]TWI50247.1 hypothetical protein IP92_01476 [Pseudoduganella flava]
MPGFLLHAGASVTCAHLGPAQPTAPNPRVTVMGMPTVLMTTQYAITGCTLPTVTSGAPPCATASWITAATRLTSNGQPLLLFDSQATCVPNGTPLTVLATQTRCSGI